MALQLDAALHEALIAGGRPRDKADSVAVGVATYLAAIETRLAAIDAKLTLLTWTLGVNIAMTAAVLARLLH